MRLEILCAGIGGRGVLLASTILIEAAIRAGCHAIASDEYGMSQRGGSVVSLVKIGDVASPLMGRESAHIVLSFEESEFYRNLSFLGREGLAVVNSPRERLIDPVERLLEERGTASYLVDSDRLAREHGMVQASNMALLGFFSRFAPAPFTTEGIAGTIREKVPAKVVEKNLEIYESGYRLALKRT